MEPWISWWRRDYILLGATDSHRLSPQEVPRMSEQRLGQEKGTGYFSRVKSLGPERGQSLWKRNTVPGESIHFFSLEG